MKTTITIGRGVVCENAPAPLIKKVRKDLTFNNPEYVNAMKFGKFISADMPSHLHLFEIEDNNCWVPRGYIYYFLEWMTKNKKKYSIRDKTLLLKPQNFKFLGKLRPYQEKAIPDLIGYPCGVLEAATGSGKTVIAIRMITIRQQPTLIIVHSKELLYQWQDQIQKFTGEECGLIGDGKYKIRPITVGIINSVRTRSKKLSPLFGYIIVDECHRISSESWADTVQDFTAKYYNGLTATPFRADGLGYAIFACLGPLRHKINKKELQDLGAVLKPDIYKINSSFSYMFTNDYSTMISELVKDHDRNTLITQRIHADLKRYNDNILIVSDRKNHCLKLQEMLLNEYNIEAGVLTGTVRRKKKWKRNKQNEPVYEDNTLVPGKVLLEEEQKYIDAKRKNVIKRVKKGECKVLIATTSLIGEGFDAPDLTAMFLGTPIKYSGRLIQVVGRILRPKKGKIPRLYDVRDNGISVLEYSGYNRDRIYRKEGWKIAA